jgi:hypothetical protein
VRFLKIMLKGNILFCDPKETRITLARMIGFISSTVAFFAEK